MNGTKTAPAGTLSKRQTYKRLLFGSVIAGVLGKFALDSVGYPLVGEGVYLLGFVAFLGIWLLTDVTIMDEREREIERRAITIAFTSIGIVAVFGASALRVLAQIDAYAAPPGIATGAFYMLASQVALFAVVYVWLRYVR